MLEKNKLVPSELYVPGALDSNTQFYITEKHKLGHFTYWVNLENSYNLIMFY